MPASFKHTVPTTGMGQPNFSTCWWASYRMIYQYLKRPASSIDDRLNGIKIDVDDCKENGLADTDYAKAASVLGLKGWSGLTFSKEPSLMDFGDGTGSGPAVGLSNCRVTARQKQGLSRCGSSRL